MSKQLHKRFSTQEMKVLLQKYCDEKMELSYILRILRIKRSRFFNLLQEYRKDPDNFSIGYQRKGATRKISKQIEKNIMNELTVEKGLIEDKSIPLTFYNYSYIKDQLFDKYGQKVSLPTIITRAKKMGFYTPRRKERKSHEREILTNYTGELIQHDSSYHRFSPYAERKWYLITSLDDYSRLLLYAQFVERETSWQHILALQYVFVIFGLPFRYYVDSHSIFRFVQGRDSMWRNHYLLTDEADPQWKKVLTECNVELTYALSPQAHGKIERPYRYLAG